MLISQLKSQYLVYQSSCTIFNGSKIGSSTVCKVYKVNKCLQTFEIKTTTNKKIMHALRIN